MVELTNIDKKCIVAAPSVNYDTILCNPHNSITCEMVSTETIELLS